VKNEKRKVFDKMLKEPEIEYVSKTLQKK